VPYRHRFCSVVLLALSGCAPAPRPVCSDPGNAAEQLWCTTAPPESSSEVRAITTALTSMRARSAICARLASIVLQMLLRDRVHLFDAGQYSGAGGLAPIGLGPGSWMLISRDVLRSPDLQMILAHESDHIRGEEHSDSAGTLTPHARQCGYR